MSLTLLTTLTAVVATTLPNAEAPGDCPAAERPGFRFAPAAADEVISLGVLAEDQTAEAPAMEQAPDPFGQVDSCRIYLHGGAGVHVNTSDNKFAQLGVGFEYFIADDLSLDFEFNGLYFEQIGDDAAAANFAMLFRWHFISQDRWSMYLDGGAGLLGSSSDVPENGSSFNFTPQAGVGITYDVGNDNRIMVGVRWHHVSNGHTYEHNPGRDSAMLYLGLSMPF